MNMFVWLIAGGVIGWLANVVMKTDGQQGLVLNVVVGVVGAFLGGFVIAPLVGSGTINRQDFSIPSLLVSLGGAVLLLGVVGFVRRSTAR